MWRRQWHPTPVLLPGKSHGQRSLVGYGGNHVVFLELRQHGDAIQPSHSVTGSSCPRSFPASECFPMSWLFTSGGQNIGACNAVFLKIRSFANPARGPRSVFVILNEPPASRYHLRSEPSRPGPHSTPQDPSPRAQLSEATLNISVRGK